MYIRKQTVFLQMKKVEDTFFETRLHFFTFLFTFLPFLTGNKNSSAVVAVGLKITPLFAACNKLVLSNFECGVTRCMR
jgi:hypothetical protein